MGAGSPFDLSRRRRRVDRAPKASTNDSGTRDLTDVVSDSGSDGPATTLMVRNIPPAYTEDMLMEEWPMDLGYDFFYLPRNNKGKVNLGYAFLNFVSETHAEALADLGV